MRNLQKITEKCKLLSDGSYYYWPNESIQQCYCAKTLRRIADQLDKLNNEVKEKQCQD